MPESWPRPPANRRWQHGWQGGPPHGFAGHAPGWQRKRRFFLRRIAALFLLLLLLLFGLMAAMALLVTQLTGGDRQDLVLVWLGGCGLALLIPLLIVGAITRLYRRYAAPLADVMAAADAVADGDLSVRVSEDASGEIGGLARSFNRMAAELEHNDRLRRNLTADVAHELRTPLHIIQGNLEGLLDGIYAPTETHIGATLDETRALARLVEDLQTISLAEAGQLPLQWESVDVQELLDDIATSFGPAAAAANVKLVVMVAQVQMPLVVDGDPGRLDQALTNLVANALRHTPAGGHIWVEASMAQARIQITVQDDGDGIPAQDLPFVFDRFWRGDRARSRSDGVGGGLGLAIVRQLIDAHGGEISVESVEGKGSTFVVTLPQSKQREVVGTDTPI